MEGQCGGFVAVAGEVLVIGGVARSVLRAALGRGATSVFHHDVGSADQGPAVRAVLRVGDTSHRDEMVTPGAPCAQGAVALAAVDVFGDGARTLRRIITVFGAGLLALEDEQLAGLVLRPVAE